MYANIYQSDRIVRIDAATGEILNWYDLEGLLPDAERIPTTDVLNGIAVRTETGKLLVTGLHRPAVVGAEDDLGGNFRTVRHCVPDALVKLRY